MSAFLNKVVIVGNLGADAETRELPNGGSMVRFRAATTRKYTTATGEKREETGWFNYVIFGKLGESIGKYLLKGKPVLVTGQLQQRNWEDKNGQKRESVEIKVEDLQLLGSPTDSNGGDRTSAPARKPAANDDFSFEGDDDIVPF